MHFRMVLAQAGEHCITHLPGAALGKQLSPLTEPHQCSMLEDLHATLQDKPVGFGLKAQYELPSLFPLYKGEM